MSPDTRQHDISKQRVIYSITGSGDVAVRQPEPYRVTEGGALTIDLYSSSQSKDVRLPAVIFVTGFADPGAQRIFGRKLKDMASYVSWAQLVAASGLAAIIYENCDPVADADRVVQHVRSHAASLGIDETRIGLWSCSGNAPTALSLLKARRDLRCAVLYYPYTLDIAGSTRVADAAARFKFANPSQAQLVDDLPRECSLFIARSGRDEMPGLNDALDRFVAQAVTCNLPITFVNHPTGPHAFDLFDDSEASRALIRQTLAFLQLQLLG